MMHGQQNIKRNGTIFKIYIICDVLTADHATRAFAFRVSVPGASIRMLHFLWTAWIFVNVIVRNM